MTVIGTILRLIEDIRILCVPTHTCVINVSIHNKYMLYMGQIVYLPKYYVGGLKLKNYIALHMG